MYMQCGLRWDICTIFCVFTCMFTARNDSVRRQRQLGEIFQDEGVERYNLWRTIIVLKYLLTFFFQSYLHMLEYVSVIDTFFYLPVLDQIPYVESGTYVAYNNESGGVIQRLKEDGIIDLDSEFHSVPEWISMKAMVSSWLADAIMYELWVGTDGSAARRIYYSELPWIIGKALFLKQVYLVKQRLGITKENAEQREEEIYKRAKIAFGALSNRLGEQDFLFDRPSSLDASFLAHLLFTLNALPDTSVLRSALLEYGNLPRYAEKLKTEFLDTGSSSSPCPQSQSVFSSSSQRKGPSNSNSKPKRKPKREKTQEEKDFSRKAKYFLVTQLVAVLLFLSFMGGYDSSEADDGDEGFNYD